MKTPRIVPPILIQQKEISHQHNDNPHAQSRLAEQANHLRAENSISLMVPFYPEPLLTIDRQQAERQDDGRPLKSAGFFNQNRPDDMREMSPNF
jgi:hypothetical protein